MQAVRFVNYLKVDKSGLRNEYIYKTFTTIMRYILYFTVIFLFSACHTKQPVDLIVHHGRIYTVDSIFSIAEAFAVKDGKIIAVGKNEDVLNNYSTTNVVDAQGKAVYPGFIDAHAHFVGYGRGLFAVDLFDSKDWTEVVERVKAFAKEHPTEAWIH